jgi:hypothetical protein
MMSESRARLESDPNFIASIELGLVVDTTKPNSMFRVKFRKCRWNNALRHIVGHRPLVALPIRQRNRARLTVAWLSNGLKEVPHASAS